MLFVVPTLLAFVVTFVAARRSLVAGLATMLSVGYAYGIVRAHLAGSSGYFVFDAAVLAIYLARLTDWRMLLEGRDGGLGRWVLLLSLWPVLLFLVPLQELLVQLVGLRGNMFFVPMLLIGAALTAGERYRLATWFAVLNIAAFALAVAEYFIGVHRFFPEREATEIIYASRDVLESGEFRIPSSFYNAHAYAGTMVATLPWLIGAWASRGQALWRRNLVLVAVGASLLGVLMSAARTPFLIAALVVLATTIALYSRPLGFISWSAVVAVVAWVVTSQERLQRFASLQDTEFVTDRVAGSINATFFDLVSRYPLGNGLGGGGTNMPYFLQERVVGPYVIENEYARILLELGVPGLAMWIVFLLWLFGRGLMRGDAPALGRRLGWLVCAASFALGALGLGTLASVPHTSLLLLTAGWVAARTAIGEAPDRALRPAAPTMSGAGRVVRARR